MNIAAYLAAHSMSQQRFANRIGVSQGLIWQWIAGVKPVAAERCIAIERETGGAVTCEELRPDVDWAVLRGTRRRRA